MRTPSGNIGLERRVAADFARARRIALVRGVVALLSGEPNHLLPFTDVRRSLGLREEVYAGLRWAEVTQIVGSVNRVQDFDRSFLPLRSAVAERWKQVDRAYYQAVALPPPILLQVGGFYFAYDGHNRISVARLHGIQRLEADIVNLPADIPLDGRIRPDDLLGPG